MRVTLVSVVFAVVVAPVLMPSLVHQVVPSAQQESMVQQQH